MVVTRCGLGDADALPHHLGGRVRLGLARVSFALQHGDGVKDAAGVVNDRGGVRFRKVEIRTL